MDFIEEFDTAISHWAQRDIIDSVAGASEEEVFEFVETLSLITKYHFKQETKPNENFSFIANSSLSGGRFPCSQIECREVKLNQLISFSSLYADEVYIQNPFEEIYLKGMNGITKVGREEIIHGILNYIKIKPLIEKGLIKYANNMVTLCEHHSNTLAKPLAEKIQRKEDNLYGILKEHLIDRCSISFDIGEGAGPFLQIKGPEGFIEHGVSYLHLFDPLPQFFQTIKNKKLPYTLPKDIILKEELMSLIIDPILRDLSYQEWHTNFYGTSYLCDNPTQLKIASKINTEAYIANSEAFEKGMNHYLPTLYSKEPKSIISLREQEAESFAVYRDKINKMMRTVKNWSCEEVSEMFRDEILPEINLIDKKVKDWKHKTRTSLKEKVLFGSGAVSIGLYAGVLPTDIGQIIAAVGGSTAVVSALMDYNKTLKEKDEARANDFYFLWQANK